MYSQFGVGPLFYLCCSSLVSLLYKRYSRGRGGGHKRNNRGTEDVQQRYKRWATEVQQRPYTELRIHYTEICDHEVSLKKFDEIQINIPHIQLNWSFSLVNEKSVEMSCLANKSKIVFLAFTEPYLQLFLQLLFLWQKHMLFQNAWCGVVNFAKFH